MNRLIFALAAVLSLLGANSAWAIEVGGLYLKFSAESAARILPALNSISPQPAGCPGFETELSLKPILISDGTDSTGGNAHSYRPNGPACFLGDEKPVKACYVKGPSFGISDEELKGTIDATFRQWVAYIKTRNIETAYGEGDMAKPFNPAIDIADICKGDEDLRFVFGAVEDAQAKKARALYPEPWGLASCSRATSGAPSGKGLIWIAAPKSIDGYLPDWKVKNSFYALMLRETGRLFGNGLSPGTIMREDLTDYLNPNTTYGYLDRDRMLSEIDHERALSHGEDHVEHLIQNADARYQYRQGFAFRKLMGRPAAGPIHEEFTITEDSRKHDFEPNGALTITDGTTPAKKFTFRVHNGLMCTSAGEPTFLRILNSGGSSGTASSSCVRMGYLTNEEGQKFPIGLGEDSGPYRYQMILADEPAEKNEVFSFEAMEKGNEVLP